MGYLTEASDLLRGLLGITNATDLTRREARPRSDPDLAGFERTLAILGDNDQAMVSGHKVYSQWWRAPETRLANYELYDLMDDVEGNGFAASALDMVSEDATQPNLRTRRVIWVEGKNSEVQAELNRFIAKHGIAGRLSQWTRIMAKYGDFPLIVHGGPGGITSLNDSSHPGRFARIEERKGHRFNLLGYYVNGEVKAPWEVIHFRLPGSAVEDDHAEVIGKSTARIPGEYRPKRLNTEYGNGLLYPVRRIFRQLNIAEEALILGRLTNSIKRYLFKVVVGHMNADGFKQVKAYAEPERGQGESRSGYPVAHL